MSRVNTPPARPKGVLLARASTSSSSLKLSSDITGPKISSRTMVMSSFRSSNTVGDTKLPFSKPATRARSPPINTLPPSCLPFSM